MCLSISIFPFFLPFEDMPSSWLLACILWLVLRVKHLMPRWSSGYPRMPLTFVLELESRSGEIFNAISKTKEMINC